MATAPWRTCDQPAVHHAEFVRHSEAAAEHGVVQLLPAAAGHSEAHDQRCAVRQRRALQPEFAVLFPDLVQPHGADLQPGQRPDLRARRQLLRPRLPPDAGAARVLRLHAVPQPEHAAELRLGRQRLQLCDHLHRERVLGRRPHLRHQRAHAGRDFPPDRPRHRRRGGAHRHRAAAALCRPEGRAARRPAGDRPRERLPRRRPDQLDAEVEHRRARAVQPRHAQARPARRSARATTPSRTTT
jgi:hypothetical protein